MVILAKIREESQEKQWHKTQQKMTTGAMLHKHNAQKICLTGENIFRIPLLQPTSQRQQVYVTQNIKTWYWASMFNGGGSQWCLMLVMINNKARSQGKCNIESDEDACGDSVVGQLIWCDWVGTTLQGNWRAEDLTLGNCNQAVDDNKMRGETRWRGG